MNRRRPVPRNQRIAPPAVEPDQGRDTAGRHDQARRTASKASGGWFRRKRRPAKARDEAASSRRLEHLKAVAGVVFVVVTALMLAWGVRTQVTRSPRFALRSIRVVGTMQRTPEQITKEAGLKLGDNLFAIDLEQVRERVLADPWIVSATVRRRIPSGITIEVTEREAAAVVVIGQLPYLATFDGKVFKQVEPGDPDDLVVITGISHDQVAEDRKAVQATLRRAIGLAETWKRYGDQRNYPAQEVHIDELGDLTLVVGKEPTELRMGQGPYRKKVMRAARVLREVRRRRGRASLVFLDNRAHPDRVVVRMR